MFPVHCFVSMIIKFFKARVDITGSEDLQTWTVRPAVCCLDIQNRAGSLNRDAIADATATAYAGYHRHRSFSAAGDSWHRQWHRDLKI